MPRGLRSFQPEDSDFFLELLPGPRGPDGLPTSLRFWKTRIEERNPDRTFPVGLIYGPSGCGKSSLVKAGLLPRLSDTIQPVFIEATADDTETRLLKGLRGAFPGLGTDLNLIDTFITLRREAGATGRKTLIVIDQFEQWLHAKTEEEKSDLALALRLCDGANVQCIVMIRDDFWLGTNRLMKDIGVHISEGENAALVDLFDVRHARKVLGLFADAYGVWENSPVEPSERAQFLDNAVSGLAQDDRVICVRIALFCELFQGKPWDLKTLTKVGGVEGVGVLFMEETFSADNAPAENRYHQKAIRAVLNALLPEPGSKIKGRMRSDRDLMDVSGYADRPDDFQALVRILDEKTHLITPTDPEGLGAEGGGLKETAVGRFYQLTHDYLVPPIREWLTRKQKETRRGRAEIRLADRAMLWNAKEENRHLPSVWEWADIRLLTRQKDWTEPQRRMMKKAQRVHGTRGLMLFTLLLTTSAVGLWTRSRVLENENKKYSSALVQELFHANLEDVPVIISDMREYRLWVDPILKQELQKAANDSQQQLHSSLALLSIDPSQVEYLTKRILKATPTELSVIWKILKDGRQAPLERFRSILDDPNADPDKRFRAACLLAKEDDSKSLKGWSSGTQFVIDRLLKSVSENPSDYKRLIGMLSPKRVQLLAPLRVSLRDSNRTASERRFATNIVTDFFHDDPTVLFETIMGATFDQFDLLLPKAQALKEPMVALLEAELEKQPSPSWNDTALDPSWSTPSPALVAKIEAAHGMLTERFALCQTMPLDVFLALAEELRATGFRPIRFRPYVKGSTVHVAAVWTRDGRPWRIASGVAVPAIAKQNADLRAENMIPVDVAGYVVTESDGRKVDRYAGLWVQQPTPIDESRMSVGLDTEGFRKADGDLLKAGYSPFTLQVFLGADGQIQFSGVSFRAGTAFRSRIGFDQAEPTYDRNAKEEIDKAGFDVNVRIASERSLPQDRAARAIQAAEKTLEAKPLDPGALLNRGVANFRLGNDQKAIDDLSAYLKQISTFTAAYKFRALAHARMGHRTEAMSDLAAFVNMTKSESGRLAGEVSVTTLLDEETEAVKRLEALLDQTPSDQVVLYDAACAYSRASGALAGKDVARAKVYSERAISLLSRAIKNGYSRFDLIDVNPDFDPIHAEPGLREIFLLGKQDRRYDIVWRGTPLFGSVESHGLDPVEHLQYARKRHAEGYRPVALSAASLTDESVQVTASTWHRPLVPEADKETLATRRGQAALALVLLGRPGKVWPLFEHTPDPRVRSYIVNGLKLVGADPKVITAQLAANGAGEATAPVGDESRMESILFHPQVSKRRALILALGQFDAASLSPVDREPLISKLLETYRDDPDAGIHGAAEWTLRRWKQEYKLPAIDEELWRSHDWGNRRWRVNIQGQTFALIDGPLSFKMGSPSTEFDREHGDKELLHRKRIDRRFAIGTKEVTNQQYFRFIENAKGIRPSLNTGSPELAGPYSQLNWYSAAEYCNWLSNQESLEPCYEPAPNGAYDAGMKLVDGFLKRSGYRLATEAEWEYAFRAGAATSRYYGESAVLDGFYVSNLLKPTSCGLFQPNDLGLFDMLGNVAEWCLDDFKFTLSPGDDTGGYSTEGKHIISEKRRSVYRGFNRAAFRFFQSPGEKNSGVGFRIVRTYP